MGQFASKEYDGDPYVDLMRALPERELIWWVQKAIWLVEGFTFLDHFGRTYPTLFIHKCKYCNGAGCMTCPHCAGAKLRAAPTAAGRLNLTDLAAAAASPSSSRALVQSSSSSSSHSAHSSGWTAPSECQHCGGYCDWDDESEWEDKWMEWERKLAYYDRTYGELMNEWYEDVLHEGNLDEDTPHEDGPEPGEAETGAIADYDRRKRKFPAQMRALMARFGGHPYDEMDLLPFNVVDPIKRTPLENLWAMGHNRNELPPELHPYNFPELLLLPTSPLTEHDNQVRMEAILCRNLDAALRNTRKPYVFEPTAGTVPCPSCYGTPYAASLFPNLEGIFRMELPTWQRVLGRMSRFTTQPAALADAAGRHYLEYPQQDGAVSVLQQELVAQLEGQPAAVEPRVARRRAIRKGARASLVGGVDLAADPHYLEDWGTRGLAADNCGAIEPDAMTTPGPHRQPEGGPLVSSSATSPWGSSSSSTAGPAMAAALLHDVRRLRRAQNSAAEQEVWAQLQERYSPAALAAMGKLAADASSSRRAANAGASSSSSSGRQQQRRGGPAESALLAEVPPQWRK